MSDWKQCPKCQCMNLNRESCVDCGRDLKDVAAEQPQPPPTAEAKPDCAPLGLLCLTVDEAKIVKRGADSQQRLVRLVLAGNHHQAERYAREMGWQPRDWRYLAGEEYAHGFRDVELHKVGTWYERADAAEIFGVLEPTHWCAFLKPNDQALPQGGAKKGNFEH